LHAARSCTGRAIRSIRPPRSGRSVSAAHRGNVLSHVARARAQGAQLALGGADAVLPGTGAFVAPTLFTGTDNTMDINRLEVFGPVASVLAFDTEDEAIALANNSVYGLAAAVWTADLNRAHRCVGALEAGVVWVNCFGDGDMTQPFGGYKQSGNSRDKHIDSLRSYMQGKSAWFSLG
jgi:acyl-CoA reductase-like NAD-dependent aldehyde dehydrogenase